MQKYLKIITTYKRLILFVAVFCAILTFVFLKIYPTTYTASTLFTINRVNKAEGKDFSYDNYYYSIQATETVGNTVVGFLQSPEVILEIFKEAGLEKEIKNILQEVKKFRPRQISSHLIRLKITTAKAENSEKLANASQEVLKNKVKTLETTFEKKNSFDISAEKPIIFTNRYNPLVVTILGFVCGLFLGLGLTFLFEYFREDRSCKKN